MNHFRASAILSVEQFYIWGYICNHLVITIISWVKSTAQKIWWNIHLTLVDFFEKIMSPTKCKYIVDSTFHESAIRLILHQLEFVILIDHQNLLINLHALDMYGNWVLQAQGSFKVAILWPKIRKQLPEIFWLLNMKKIRDSIPECSKLKAFSKWPICDQKLENSCQKFFDT